MSNRKPPLIRRPSKEPWHNDSVQNVASTEVAQNGTARPTLSLEDEIRVLKDRLRADAFLAKKLADEERGFVADERRVYLLKCQLLLAQRRLTGRTDVSAENVTATSHNPDDRDEGSAWAPEQGDLHSAEQQLRSVLKLMEQGCAPPKEVLVIACESLFRLGLKPMTGNAGKPAVVPRWHKNASSPALKDVDAPGELTLEVPKELAKRWFSLVDNAPRHLREDMQAAVLEMQQLAAQWRFLVTAYTANQKCRP